MFLFKRIGCIDHRQFYPKERRRNIKKTPVLLTLDVHPQEKVAEYVYAALEILQDLEIKATFFVPICVIEENINIARMILDGGHEIGSHGLFHNNREPYKGFPPERYDRLAPPLQRRFIEEATKIAKNILGRQINCFRSPCFGISGSTLALLEEYGYQADFSVNSQRLDFLSSHPFGYKQLFAPRLPYHPSLANPFRKGDAKIWEIPLSSFIFPFAVMALITFRRNLTNLFFNLLHAESRLNSKPIVYMCHPEEFSPQGKTYTIPIRALRPKDFLPLPGEGMRVRQALRMSDPAKICQYNIALLKYIRSFKDVVFITAKEYLNEWLVGDA